MLLTQKLKLNLQMRRFHSLKQLTQFHESLGIVVGTDGGNIVYTGDFKFDQAARKYYRTDLSRLTEIGREGVLALLSDSANATSNVLTASESEVAAEMDSIIADAEGRVIIAAVALT